jgi:hypothetical protein
MTEAYNLSTEAVGKLVTENGKINPEIYSQIKERIEEVSNKYSTLITRQTVLTDV